MKWAGLPAAIALMASTLAWGQVATRPSAPAAPPAPPEGTTDDIESTGDLTVVTSDRLTYDAQRGFALFDRNVVVSDPSLKMKADKLVIYFGESNKVSSLVAEGPVILSQEDKRAWAGRAVYDVLSGKITLEQDPRISRGRDLLLGETIIFYRDQNRMEVTKGARLIVDPRQPGAGEFLPRGGSR